MSSGAQGSLQSATKDIASRKVAPLTIVLFASTSFLSAFLLFQVQLIVSKYILPWFGGSAAVWTTSMLIFQLLLLAGYIYSHLVSARLAARTQTKVHQAVLLAAFLLLVVLTLRWPSAITPSTSLKPQTNDHPVWSVACIIAASAGLPFFVLSTTGPLLQRWFAHLGGGTQTYKLYSISNLGSLLGLLTFPFLFEPAMPLKSLGTLWTVLFWMFIGGCLLCAAKARRAVREFQAEITTPSIADSEAGPFVDTEIAPLTYLLWFLLAFCPSSLLLATTNLLCQEVTSVPLLWVLPLSIYLLSFIICFDNPRWYRRAIFHPLFAATLLWTCVAIIYFYLRGQFVLLPSLLFLTCMIGHGELVRLKPGVKHLTAFYLTISAGGAAGGIFVGIIAPHVFTFFTEFQLTLAASIILLLVCLLLDSNSWIFATDFRLLAAMTLGLVLAAYLAQRWIPGAVGLIKALHFYQWALTVGGVLTLACFLIERRSQPQKPGFRAVQIYAICLTTLAMLALYHTTQLLPGLYFSSRNFYGAVRVFRFPGGKGLMHGRVLHGAQLNPPYDRVPIVYYGSSSGVGIVMENLPKRSAGESVRVGLVGLGAGSLAAYGRAGDYFRYYEIDPDVLKLSSGTKPVFTFLHDSAARVDVELGDGRLLLEQELSRGEKQNFDLMVLDAFAGDAIPVHLLTREAFGTYWQHLAPDGVIAIHASTQHVNLLPVVKGIVSDFHADFAMRTDVAKDPFWTSCWLFLARRPGALAIQGLDSALPPDKPTLWTDDYSTVYRLLR